MQEGSSGYDIKNLSEEERERLAETEIRALREKTKKPQLGQGTDPGIENVPVGDGFANEVTKVYKRLSNLDEDVAGIMEGLDKAAAMSVAEKNAAKFSKSASAERKAAAEAKKLAVFRAEEERVWEGAILVAKQKIAAEEGRLAGASTGQKDKSAGLRLKAKIEDRLKIDEEARQKADDERWEDAEWAAKIKIAKKQEENRWSIANLKKKLGIGKNKEKK